MTLFFLEAFEHVHKSKAEAYERMGAAIDDKVKETEPGMLIHTHTKISEDDEKVVYRWLEVFQNYEDMQVHLENPHVQAHIEKLNDGILCAPLEIILYCDWTEEQKEPLRQLTGIRLSFAPLVNGYFR